MIRKSKQSFKFFFNTIFSISIEEVEGKFIPGAHIDEWCDRLQYNTDTATVSARLHAKSMTFYGFLGWKLYCIDFLPGLFPEILYLSYNENLAGYHVQKAKRLIEVNPYFADYKNVTTAETIIKYKKGMKTLTVMPAGIGAFKRGMHTIGVLSDDILQDPQAAKMDLSQIDKITNIFFEQVVSIRKKFGFNHVTGTAQDKTDLFFKLQKHKKYNWRMYKAIISHKKKQVLWKDMFSYDDLITIRDDEIGPKAFNKEFMCSPVRSEESYFKDEEIENRVGDRVNVNINKYKTDNIVIGGLDIGKKVHPSHFVAYELIPIIVNEIKKIRMIQLISKFMDGWDYTKQLEYCQLVIEKLGIYKIRFDNTRGEFESFIETGELPTEMEPFVFTAKSKNTVATYFDRKINDKTIEFVQDERQVRQILSVDNDLDAPESAEGHGDPFWSNALACSIAEEGLPNVRWL